jgi:secondary thiamine-phosphate synthase enzyme
VVVASGAFLVRTEQLVLASAARLEVRDVTDDVMALIRAMDVREGTATLQSLHTTCAVAINESQDALNDDFLQFLEAAVDPAVKWRHDDPALSDCDRQNTDAHLRALWLSPCVTLQVSGGELVLGRWQRVLVVELDGPRTRTVRLQVMGIG